MAETKHGGVQIREVALTEEILSELTEFSRDWENEHSTWGYRKNGREDIEGMRVFLARENGRTIGYLFGKAFVPKNMYSVIPREKTCFEIEELYVIPSERSRGVGRALFEFTENAVRDEAEYITLSTATKNWRAILNFYITELGMEFWSARLFRKIETNKTDGTAD